MRKTLLWVAVLMMSLSTIQAAPSVIYEFGSGYAVGIVQLNVNGGTFNVEFVPDSYDGTYAVDDPIFLGNAPFADAAADAIMNVLNNEAVVPVISGGESEALWVPYDDDGQGDFLAKQVGHSLLTNPWQRYADFSGQTATDYSDPPESWLFARFTRVPEPTTLAMMGMGAIALIRRKR